MGRKGIRFKIVLFIRRRKELLSKFTMNKSIKGNLTISFIIPLVLLSFILTFVLYQVSMSIINTHVITQFEERLKIHMNELESDIDSKLVNKAINDPEAYNTLVSKLNSFMADKTNIEYAYVIGEVDNKEVIIALNDADEYLTESPFTEDQRKAFETKTEIMSEIYEDDYGVHKSIFRPIPNSQAVLGIDVDATFVKDLKRFIFIIITVAIIGSIIIAFIASTIVSRRFAKPIYELVEHINHLSKGDLLKPIKTNRQDELGLLAQRFEEMRQRLSKMIKQIHDNSLTIEEKSSSLNVATEEITESTKQVAASTAQEAKGAEERTKHIEELSDKIQMVSNSMNTTDEAIDQMVNLTENAQSLAFKGNTQVKTITDQMEKIKSQGEQTTDHIKDLGERSKKIFDIINIISDISAQINLLSLNASIEAARAGEAGKGFSVVAQEVQSLANQTDESVSHVNENIQEILTKTDEVIDMNDKNFEEILKGVELLRENGKLFEQINQSVDELTDKTLSIKKETGQITVATSDSLSAVQEIAAISEESTAATQEISASAEQQNSSAENLKELSKELDKTSKDLETIVRSFKVQ